MRNGSFEDGWYHPNDIPELQIPNEYEFSYNTGENPVNSDPWNKFVRPEVRVLPKDQLPPDEQDLFILDGNYCLKVFKDSGAWNAAFSQSVPVKIGVNILNIRVYGDLVMDYDENGKMPAKDPLSGRIRVIIDDEPQEWESLTPLRWSRYTFPLISEYNSSKVVKIEFMLPHALKNSGIFADLWTTELIYTSKGEPREQYKRTYVLFAPSAGFIWPESCNYLTWDDKRYTLGGSADDGGIGNLEYKRVVAINPQEWTGNADDLRAFYKTHYPSVIYESITEEHPDVAAARLVDEDFDKNEPSGGYDGPVYPKVTNKHVGLHTQGLQDGIWEFASQNPSVMKFLSQTDCGTCKLVSPLTTVVFRQYIAHQGQFYDNLEEGPRAFVDTFSSGLWEQINRIRAEKPDMPKPYFYAESLNELYGPTDIEKITTWDCAFADAIHDEFADYVAPALYCGAVGNPDMSVYHLMLKVARKAIEYNGLLGYHNYWWVNRLTSGLEYDWEWHSGRWEGLDEYFRNNNLYPRWYGGESSCVYGMPFLASLGWLHPDVYNGDWNLLFTDIEKLEYFTAEWNKKYGNRFIGSVLFTTGPDFIGWKWFKIRPPEIYYLTEWLST